MKLLSVLLPLCSLLWALALAQVPAPYNLQTSYLINPLGIDTPSPRLSWSLTHPSKAQYQTAFRVQVFEIIQRKQTLSWDTQQVKSTARHTTYGSFGTASQLNSASTYQWQVQWWDANGTASAWSSTASFGTGFFAATDWTGLWIGGNGNLLRKDFTVSISASSVARLYISGIGYYIAEINGKLVSDTHLDVGWTDYSKRVYYSVFDVASLLVNGSNAIGIMQGHGWYSSTEDREPDGARSTLLQLLIDGKTVVQSDKTWTIAQGPVTYDGVYNGETYDARLEQEGWSLSNFTGKGWQPVSIESAPGGVLSYQAIPPVREIVEILPKQITNPQPGIYLVDFEQNFSGWCKITMTAPAGTNITLRHAEVLLKDGSGLIYVANLRSALQTDTYLFKGSSTPEVYEPHFTYHGFRYVQITVTNSQAIPTLSNIVAYHAFSDVGVSGEISFTASSDVLNQIQHNILWGQSSNLMSVPTDCDQRDERKGWMGDAQLSAEEALHNFYMPAFYTNFLNLIQDEQGTDGTLTDTTPFTFGARPADPAWGAAYPSILYWLWKYHDDIEVVAQHYNSIKFYFSFLNKCYSSTGLAKFYYNYGDWVPPEGVPMCSSHLTSSFSYLAGIQQLVEMATALGQTADAEFYRGKLDGLYSEFNDVFYFNGTYDTGLQSAVALPLAIGVVPEDVYQRVLINWLNNIVSDYDTHLTTGIIGTKYEMLALHQIGRDDIALQLAENFDYPSWGYMVLNPTEPATTLWELWETPSGNPGMDSRNHIMFGSVGDWFYKALAGIDHPDSDAGFQNFVISPSVVGDLLSVSATFLTGSGNISVAWQKQGGDLLCGTAAEGHTVSLDCASIGSKGVIEEISFASYGTPFGTCGHYGERQECHTITAKAVVESQCIGKPSCSFLAHETVLGAASCDANTFKRLHVEAKCTEAASTSFSLQASIPVGSSATVALPSLGLSNIQVTANGASVWNNHKYIASATAGISRGFLSGTKVNFVAGSGEYTFQLSGSPSTVKCASTTEGFSVALSCPANQVITAIPFASFGNPDGTCGAYRLGWCNAGSSMLITETACLLKNNCTVNVGVTIFGEPCYSYPKEYVVQVLCGST
jgi:alpha-L-rhamnosidase